MKEVKEFEAARLDTSAAMPRARSMEAILSYGPWGDDDFDRVRAELPHRNPPGAHGTGRVWMFSPRKYVVYSEALRRVELTRTAVVARFGDWVVTDYGLECLSHYYPIKKGRLWEHYPVERHMDEKVWVNMPAFLKALEYARSYHEASRPK